MSTRNSILAFLGGAAAGAIVALLYAPERGDVTRRRIGKQVENGRDRVMDAMERGKYKIEDSIRMGKMKIEDAILAGRAKMEDVIASGTEQAEEVMRKTKNKIHDEMATFCEDKVIGKK